MKRNSIPVRRRPKRSKCDALIAVLLRFGVSDETRNEISLQVKIIIIASIIGLGYRRRADLKSSPAGKFVCSVVNGPAGCFLLRLRHRPPSPQRLLNQNRYFASLGLAYRKSLNTTETCLTHKSLSIRCLISTPFLLRSARARVNHGECTHTAPPNLSCSANSPHHFRPIR